MVTRSTARLTGSKDNSDFDTATDTSKKGTRGGQRARHVIIPTRQPSPGYTEDAEGLVLQVAYTNASKEVLAPRVSRTLVCRLVIGNRSSLATTISGDPAASAAMSPEAVSPYDGTIARLPGATARAVSRFHAIPRSRQDPKILR